MFELPTERTVAPEYDVINKLLIVGHQGSGKTHAVSQLPNSLIIDFEQGCKDHYEARKVDIQALANTHNVHTGKVFKEIIANIRAKNAEKQVPVYDFIVFDGVTALEKLVHQTATALFKNSVVGKGMVKKGTLINDVITDVPESGWLWYFRAWESIYEQTLGLAKYATIYLGHAKQGSLVKAGQRLEANDLALTGKAKLALLRDVDASCMCYREGNKCTLSFKQNDRDLTTKARARHLNDQDIIISEMVDGKLVTHWEKVFPQLKPNDKS